MIPITRPLRVEERPAGVALVDRRVGLDRVEEVVRVVSDGIVRPVPETTPTDSEASAPKGEPIAATGCPTATPARVAERHGHEPVRLRRHLEHADVVVGIPADDLRLHPVAVAELDVDAPRRRRVSAGAAGRDDHVRGGEDLARASTTKPGALLERRAAAFAPKYEKTVTTPGMRVA